METDGEIALPIDRAIWFGPFCLRPAQQLLLEADTPVRIGARALDLLIALVERAGDVVTKDELVARVWPGLSVDEGNLRTQMALARKALRDGQAGARYLITVPGRGYRFVAPVSIVATADFVEPAASVSGLPTRLTRLIGRADAVRDIVGRLNRRRFITITGPGGIGKTSVALAVAEQAAAAYDDGVCVVDCAPLLGTSRVARKLASMFGLEIADDDPTRGLVAFLRTRRMLVVLDSCERVVEAAAVLAENLLKGAAGVGILATSREPLRAEGEDVYRLPPLEIPPVSTDLTAAEALSYPAVQLFVERAASSVDRFELSDSDASIAAHICRKLDGIALAIELAAGRVDVFGLLGVAARLDDRIRLLTHGRRTALPRHQTLGATLDWSYDVLPVAEQTVLRRLAVFAGSFTLDAAEAVATDDLIARIDMSEVVASLVSKSLLNADVRTATGRYRLLDTTRAYAAKKLGESGEFDGVARRHAVYICDRLEAMSAGVAPSATAKGVFTESAPIDEVRLALDWAFSAGGDVEIGVGLATAAAPVFLAMSLLTECHRWAERALLALDDAVRGQREEMHLQAALGISLMFTRGSSDAVRVALNRSLAIAEERADTRTQLRLLGTLHMFQSRSGDYKAAIHYATRVSALSKMISDPAALAFGSCLLGIALHRTGDFRGARLELEAARKHGPSAQRQTPTYVGYDGYTVAGAHLARTLWLLGYPNQAAALARQSVAEAAVLDHPVTLSIVLIRAIAVFRAIVDLQSLEQHIDWFIRHAQSHSLGRYISLGHGFKGQLAILRGEAHSGLENLELCLAEHRARGHELRDTVLKISLTQGLCAVGRFAESIELIDETIRLSEEHGDLGYLAELLRVKGDVLLALPRPRRADAEACFLRSLDLSRRQGSRAWELRSAVDLASLWASQGRPEDARALLRPVFEQFEPGSDSADLRGAARLLMTWG